MIDFNCPKVLDLLEAIVWEIDPLTHAFTFVGAKAEAHLETSFSVPSKWPSSSPRIAIALDVMVDDKYLGQIAEAVVDVRNRSI